MKIGNKIYYRLKDSSPQHVQVSTILEETSRSWVVGTPNQWWAQTPELIRKHGDKVPKHGTIFYSEQEAARINWVTSHRYELKTFLDFSASVEQALKVADIFGITHP